jgi:hypothetical protein
MKSQITRKALVIVLAVASLLAACSPESIITGSSTKVEQAAHNFVVETCPKSDGVHCDLMGQ